jgi:selenophosphate synthase
MTTILVEEDSVDSLLVDLLADAQTSGGLLISVPQSSAAASGTGRIRLVP